MGLQKQKNYQQAFELACLTLREMDLRERAARAGVVYKRTDERDEVVVDLFSEPYHIFLPEGEFYSPGRKVVSLVTRTILLHYLIIADGTPISGRWVAYKDVPGGLVYFDVFRRRVTDPIARRFGTDPKSFFRAGLSLGGKSGNVGDASIVIEALPRVPIEYVLWKADEEFPASVNLLFDSSVDHYLSLEDIVVLGQMTTARLIHASVASNRGASERDEQDI